ncbi:membrane hypothetical protein [Vibrio chagasii]|nr:membrane hypothetical protein [Vibrio chagasii]CAH6908937.1 membrane hypothetical protein [Vibrio chagasii]
MIGYYKFFLSTSNYFRYKQKIGIISPSLFGFIGRLTNLFVTFLPLKLLLIMSGNKKIDFIENLGLSEIDIVCLSIVLLLSLFLLNIFVSIKQGRLMSINLSLLRGGYRLENNKLTKKQAKSFFTSMVAITTDLVSIMVSIIVIVLLQPLFGLLVLLYTIVFCVIAWYYLFSEKSLIRDENHESVSIKHKAKLAPSLHFLPMFFILVCLLLYGVIGILKGMLIFVFLRMIMSSIGSITSSQLPLRKFYRTIF